MVCNPGNRCFSLDTTIIGGRRLEDYRVTNGIALNAQQRRAVLQTNRDAATPLCGVSPYAGQEAGLPTLRWRSSSVSLGTDSFTNSAGRLQANQAANIAFEGLETSDGYVAPRFGFYLVREVGTTGVSLQFRPSIDQNLAGIPGLTEDVQWRVNPATRAVTHPSLTRLPNQLQRLVLAVALNLTDLYRRATTVSTRPSAGLPVWTVSEVIALVPHVSQLIFQVPVVTAAPIRTLTCDTRRVAYTSCAEDRELSDFGKFLMKYGAQYVYMGDAASRQSLIDTYRQSAEANALRTYPGFDPADRLQTDGRIKFALNHSLGLPLALTWSAVRADPAISDADRQMVDAWLADLFAFTTAPYDGASDVYPNNHGYLSTSVKMAWGIVAGDDRAFADGIERYFMALHQMHPDGGFTWEVGRGPCSIRYQAMATGMLISIAELAASQGYNLYAVDVEGRTVHTAIQFLLDSIANPAILDQYAGTVETSAAACNLPAGAPQDLAGIAVPWSDRTTYLAFIEPYIARFPDTALAGRLRGLWPGGVTAQRPVSGSLSGGNTSCAASNDGFVRVTLSRPADEIPAAGGSGIIAVRPSSTTFAWTAQVSADWVTVPMPNGTGSADLAYHVSPNTTGSARTATISIGNQVFLVSQAGPPR